MSKAATVCKCTDALMGAMVGCPVHDPAIVLSAMSKAATSEQADYECATGHKFTSSTIEHGLACPRCKCASRLLAVYEVQS